MKIASGVYCVYCVYVLVDYVYLYVPRNELNFRPKMFPTFLFFYLFADIFVIYFDYGIQE